MPFKIISLLFFLLFFSLLALCLEKNPHEFLEAECIICHEGTTARNARQMRGSATNSCTTCHMNLFDEGYMHPVDIQPNMVTIPPDFPLSTDNLVTCNTCHDPHAAPTTPSGNKSFFLRRAEKGKAFCDICHANVLNKAKGSGHEMLFQEAHQAAKFTARDNTFDLDPLSISCISCHDGSTASSVTLKSGTWQHSTNFIKFDQGGKHPIGGDYDSIRSQKKRLELRPRSMVNKAIRFFNNGRMGCGTCHDHYSKNDKKLVLSNFRSQLCFACHNMDKR